MGAAIPGDLSEQPRISEDDQHARHAPHASLFRLLHPTSSSRRNPGSSGDDFVVNYGYFNDARRYTQQDGIFNRPPRCPIERAYRKIIIMHKLLDHDIKLCLLSNVEELFMDFR